MAGKPDKPVKGKTTTAVAVKEETALVVPMDDMMADAGAGLEGADRSSFAIPFITILQGLSPQLETVDGAKPGLFINTITNELYKEVQVIPCAFQRRYLQWAARSAGGGYRGEHNPVDVETGKTPGVVRDGDGRLKVGEDELKDTRNHFVLVKSSTGAWLPALLSLSSTQIKKSKRWMSRIQGIELRAPTGKTFTPPSFSHVYLLKAVKEENSKGSWWGLDFDMVGPVAEAEVYAKAKAFHASVVAGDIEVARRSPMLRATASRVVVPAGVGQQRIRRQGVLQIRKLTGPIGDCNERSIPSSKR